MILECDAAYGDNVTLFSATVVELMVSEFGKVQNGVSRVRHQKWHQITGDQLIPCKHVIGII